MSRFGEWEFQNSKFKLDYSYTFYDDIFYSQISSHKQLLISFVDKKNQNIIVCH